MQSDEIDDVETNSLIVSITSLHNPTVELVQSLELLITNDNGSSNLLLAYGALVANAPPDLEQEMVSFLMDRVPEGTSNNSYLLVHFLHALGNTQSELVLENILQYLQYDDEVVRVTAVTALRLFTDMPTVQDRLLDILVHSAYTEALIGSIIDALHDGYGSNEEMKLNQELLQGLVNATLSLGDDDLLMELVHLFVSVGTPDTLSLADAVGGNVIQSRHKRADTFTYDWDSNNPVYHDLCPLNQRREDVRNFPNHASFLLCKGVGQTTGIHQFYLRGLFGMFAGCSDSSDSTLIGKALVSLHAFNEVVDVFQVVGRSYTTQNGLLSVKFYVKIGNFVLSTVDGPVISYYNSITLPYIMPLPSFQLPFVIFGIRATLTVNVQIRLGGSILVSAQSSGGRVSLMPMVTAHVDESMYLAFIVGFLIHAYP